MPRFVYAVWFRDETLRGQEDYEWVACLLLDAPSAADAVARGDQLARARCDREDSLEFVSSEVRAPEDALYQDAVGELPVVRFGTHASDEEVGW